MRKGYADYGLTDKRVKELLGECQAGKYSAQVRAAAYKADPLVAEYIISSIMYKRAYDILEFDARLGHIPVGKSDFYGLRRYTIAMLNNMLTGKETV